MFGFGKKRKSKKQKELDKKSDRSGKCEADAYYAVPPSISKCEELVKSLLSNSSDIVIQSFDTQRSKAMIVYVEGLISKDLLDRDIISPLKAKGFDGNMHLAIKTHYKEVNDMSSFIDELLEGQTALFYEGSKKVFIIDIKQWDKRLVETPDSETTIRGPREGFTESIRTNIALLRRKIRTPKLVTENMIISRQGNTLYMA